MKKWLVVIVVVLALAGGAAFVYPKLQKSEKPAAKTTPVPTAPTHTPPPEPEVVLDTAEIHSLINKERSKAGIRTLTVNDNLYDSAMAKCEDMKKSNYFTHVSPSGSDYTTFIKKVIPNAKVTGENLGAGYTDINQLVKEWMESPKHKENILNTKFTSEGIAVCGKSSVKPGLIIVAHFIQG